jgi:hypothetical protein
MSGTPPVLSEAGVMDLLALDRDFDMRTVLDRSGYPPIKFRAQPWRAHKDIAFPPPADDAASCLEGLSGRHSPRTLCRGGRIYLAGTG